MHPPEVALGAPPRTVRETPSDLPEPVLSENAMTVLRRRYLKKNEDGDPIESPRDMFWRVARVIA